MKLESSDLLLYLVTDRRWLKDENLESVVEKTIKNGVTFVQLREKDLKYDEFKKLALVVKKVTDKYKVPFVINDNIDIAIEVDADGLHIGQGDLPIEEARAMIGRGKILGVSASDMEEALDAQEKGADYLGLGAIFPTSSKDTEVSLSLEELKDIKERVKIPVVAIGGINHENMHLLKNSRIDGVSVISTILAKEDTAKATRDLKLLAEKYLGGE